MDFAFSHAEINALRDIFRPQILTYNRGENVSCRSRRLYIITKGLLYICTEDELYERSILRFMRAGEPFTSAMAVDAYNGISYIQAKTACEVASISFNDLNLFLSESQPWRRRFDEVLLCGRDTAISHMLHRKTIRSRVLCFLRDEAQIQQSDSVHVPIPFSDLADYMSVERTALMKEIGKMKKDGLISGKNRDITLLV